MLRKIMRAFISPKKMIDMFTLIIDKGLYKEAVALFNTMKSLMASLAEN